MTCPYCGAEIAPIVYWHIMADGRKHLGARCRTCSRWIKWLPQTEEWLALAPEEAQGNLL